MDYNAAGAGGYMLGTEKPDVDGTRPLDRIENLAGQADNICDTIEKFIGRCRGGGTRLTANAEKVMRPVGYLPSLDRLAECLNRAQELAHDLNSIG
jgi:hypothetical protein